MVKKKLHPSVQQFKQFVKEHPKMIQEVRKGSTTWQELFEEWYLLGEDDSRWEEFKVESVNSQKNSESQKDWMPQIIGTLKNMDTKQIQGHITNLSQALGAIQGVLSQFQRGEQPGNQKQNQSTETHHPFQFRKD